MIIYPAIDLRGGKVVRLKEGDPNRQTIFSEDPLATAQTWIDQGTAWIHMVNLDGTFSTANDNERILEKAAKLNVKIQFGGGMRTLGDMARAFQRGASRVVMGTLAVEKPETVAQAVQRWGVERICVALDARDGKVTTHGWQQMTDWTPISLGKEMVKQGAKHALYTDVHRDGHLIGANIHETIMLGRETGLSVIASGGITTVEEIAQFAHSQVVGGAVIGMALYEGQLSLKAALFAAGGSHAG